MSSRSLEGVQHEHSILPLSVFFPIHLTSLQFFLLSLSICSPLFACSHTPEFSIPQDKELLSPVWDPANSILIFSALADIVLGESSDSLKDGWSG